MRDPFDWDDRADAGDGFRGYDLWKSDVGPWPSIGDDARPTNPHPRRGFWEDAIVDLTAGAPDPVPDPKPETVLDLVEEVLDLVEDIEDRTT